MSEFIEAKAQIMKLKRWLEQKNNPDNKEHQIFLLKYWLRKHN